MREPKIVLKQINDYSKIENFKYDRLIKNLYNPEFYKLAYSNIYSKPGNMTKASDGSTIDGMSIERINKLIDSLRDGSYKPTNLRRVNIPKKNGTTRPISIPSFNDKLIQEIIRMILEAIYEDTFSDYSHGFRHNRSCHTALEDTRNRFKGISWWIEGDIKGCFDNINHEILLNILRERIKDLKFIHLINIFLKNGYMENQVYHKTYSGTPQGSIISPILCNIYLDKFDKLMEFVKVSYDKGTRRKWDTKYNKLACSVRYYKKILKENGCLTDSQRKILDTNYTELKKWNKPTQNMMDPEYLRIHYIRYADDFLIGISGPKDHALYTKEYITNWFKENLKLELSNEKTKITHKLEKVRFLGYDIVIVNNYQNKLENGKVRLSVPNDVMVNFIIKNRIGKWWNSPISKKDELKAVHIPGLINLDPLEITRFYDYKIRGLYNYYCLAENVYKLGSFNYLVHTSFMRTLANKYKSTRAKLYKDKRFTKGKDIGCWYNSKDKILKFQVLFKGPFEKKVGFNTICDDKIWNTMKFFGRNSLIKRMEADVCEYCGDTTGPFQDHHIKHMKDIKSGKANWQKLMISRRRKTLHLCVSCHYKLHQGILN